MENFWMFVVEDVSLSVLMENEMPPLDSSSRTRSTTDLGELRRKEVAARFSAVPLFSRGSATRTVLRYWKSSAGAKKSTNKGM